ncbi:hypothetical protein WDV94_05045 [Clavibacter tessellarius]
MLPARKGAESPLPYAPRSEKETWSSGRSGAHTAPATTVSAVPSARASQPRRTA